MNRRFRAATPVLILLMSLPAVVAGQPQPPQVLLPEPGEPIEFSAGLQRFRVALVSGGLMGPWSIDFLPDGETLLVTESPGALRIVHNGMLSPDPVWEAPRFRGNDVLHGLAVHPDFADNGLVYVSYARSGDDGTTLAVSRGRLDGNRLVDVEEIFVADAWESASNATAGRMIFGPDRTLYVSVGDRDGRCCGPVDDNSIRIRAQDLSDHLGKVLRLTDDGGIPEDNPFVDRPGARGEIFTYGNRNTYGFAFHPETGELWSSDIGPMGGDEINILRAGGNYGWPLVSLGRNYSGTLVSEQPWYRPGMEMPRVFWVPVISPSGIAFYTGDRFPAWQGSLFVAALTGQHLQRIGFGLGGQSEQRQPLLQALGVRFRDVKQGPDGYLYVTTEVRYGSRNPDGAILRLEPAE